MGTVMATQKKKAKAQRTVTNDQFSAMSMILAHEVARTGEEIVIKQFGQPLAKLAPLDGEAGKAAMEDANKPQESTSGRDRKPWFGRDKDSIKIYGDLDEDLDIEWEAEQGLIDGE